MGKTKELLEQEWFSEAQRAELHWMEQEYEQSKSKNGRNHKDLRQQSLG